MVKGELGTTNWFHFAIPTPDIIASKNARVGSVFVRFESGSSDAYIQEVHLFDGEMRFAEFNNLRYAPENFDTIRFDPPALYEIQYGLGVSVKVVFGVDNLSHMMKFSSAGCNFVIDSDSEGKKKSNPRKNRKRA